MSARMARPIEAFQPAMSGSCTPYSEWHFSPEVVELCSDEIELLQASRTTATTNPFSLAGSISTVNRFRVAKCIVLGDISVGKTTLINRFVSDVFSDSYKATIGVDFEVQKFDILGRPFVLQIWDIAGQSRFRDITRFYYKGAHAVIVCFDLSNFQSFANVKYWLSEVFDNSTAALGIEAEPYKFLVGTKSDLISSRHSEDRLHREAIKLADQIQAEFWMVSSASGDNVAELFTRVACLTFNRYMTKVAESSQQELRQLPPAVGHTENGKKTSQKSNLQKVDIDSTNGNVKATKSKSKAQNCFEFLCKSSQSSNKKAPKADAIELQSIGSPDLSAQEMARPPDHLANDQSPKKTKQRTFRFFSYRCTVAIEE